MSTLPPTPDLVLGAELATLILPLSCSYLSLSIAVSPAPETAKNGCLIRKERREEGRKWLLYKSFSNDDKDRVKVKSRHSFGSSDRVQVVSSPH